MTDVGDQHGGRPLSPARLAVVAHPVRDVAAPLQVLRRWARDRGAELVQVARQAGGQEVAPAGDVAGSALVVALGGDGTVLAAVRIAAPAGLPVLGVRCGSLAALASTGSDGLSDALARLVAGRWQARVLPALAIADAKQHLGLGFNDLVVVRRGAGQVVVAITVDGELYARVAGDGVVVATPLGSSAYAMAAGGPVVAPAAAGAVVAPLLAHGGRVPPLVVGPSATLTLDIAEGFSGTRIEIDGQPSEMAGPRLAVEPRPHGATLVSFGDDMPPLTALRDRGLIADSPRVLARDARAGHPVKATSGR